MAPVESEYRRKIHLLDHVRVELPVPGAEEGRGDVQPLAVEA